MKQAKSYPTGRQFDADFAYRFLLGEYYNSREKVYHGRVRLTRLCWIQLVIHLLGLIYYTIEVSNAVPEKKSVHAAAIFSISAGFSSISVAHSGEPYGTRVRYLKLYLVQSTFALFMWMQCLIQTDSTFEIIQNPSCWETKKGELFQAALVLLGLLVLIFQHCTAVSLIRNISYVLRIESEDS